MATKTQVSHNLSMDSQSGLLILRITETKGTKQTRNYYRVEKNPNSKHAFRLHKLVHSDEEPVVYDVMLYGSNAGCDCRGFESHNHCKHFDSINALREDGEL